MAQDYQRQYRAPQHSALEQNQLVEKLSAVLQETHARNESEDMLQEENVSIDLAALFFKILSKIHYVIIAAVLCTILAGVYAEYGVVPVYRATSKLYIVNSSGVQVSVSDLQIASTLTRDYLEVFNNWVVHEKVIEKLDLKDEYSYSKLQSMISVKNPEGTRLLYISATHPDPQMAMDLANAYAEAAQEFIYNVMEREEPNEFAPALLPTTPEGMGRTRYMLLGFIGGAALVVVVIMMMFLLDDRPHTPDDITQMAGIPTLAVVPRAQNMPKRHKRVIKHKEGRKG